MAMKPISDATVAYMLNSNILYIELAKHPEHQVMMKIKEHYDALPGFRVEFNLPKITISPNSNFAQSDVIRDLAELLKSIDGIKRIRWSWAQGVEEDSSDSVEGLLETMPIITNHIS